MKTFILWALMIASAVPAFAADPVKKWAKPEYIIKFGTLVPQGTAWSTVLEDCKRYVEDKSLGRAKVQFYMGGVMGDERDMVRKMKLDQLQGGGFSFEGIHNFFPELMIMELPFLFDSYEEVDYVFQKMYPAIDRILAEKGFVLLGLGEEGMQMIFSARPVRTPEDFHSHKCWIWEDEPVQFATYKALGVDHPIPTPVTGLLEAFQNGMVDLTYVSPMAVVGLQIYTKVKYCTMMNFRYNPALYLMTKKYWDSLPGDLRKTFLEAVVVLKKSMKGRARVGQDNSIAALTAGGIQFITPTTTELEVLKKATRPVWDEMVGKLYPRALLDEVLGYKEEFRKITSDTAPKKETSPKKKSKK